MANGRVRLAAVLTLLAFALAVAETVWAASRCLSTGFAAAGAVAPPAPGANASAHDEHQPRHGPDGGDTQSCPFASVSAGCSFLLFVSVPVQAPAPLAGVGPIAAVDAPLVPQLVGASVFHPPRA